MRRAEHRRRARGPCNAAAVSANPADSSQIKHSFGGAAIGIPEMLRCARTFGLKARVIKRQWHHLAEMPVPAIAALRGGGFLLLGKVTNDAVLVQLPYAARPELISRIDFEAMWDGQLILMTRRAGLQSVAAL